MSQPKKAKNSAAKNGSNGKKPSATEKARKSWGAAEVHKGGKEKKKESSHAAEHEKPRLYMTNDAGYYKPSPDQRQYKPYVIAQGKPMHYKHSEKPAGYNTARLKAQTAKALALAVQRGLRAATPTISNFYAYKSRGLSDSQRDYLKQVLKEKGYTEKEIPTTDNGLVDRVRAVINGDILRYSGPYSSDIVDHLEGSPEKNIVARTIDWVKDAILLEYYNFTWSKKKTYEFNRQTLDRNPEDVVVVGHGLWQNAGGMYLVAQHLRKLGYDVLLLEYSGNTRWPWKTFGPKFMHSDAINESTAHQAVANLESLIEKMPNVKRISSVMHSDGENILATLYKGSSPYIKRMLERGIQVIPGGDQRGNYTGLGPLHTVGVVGGKDFLVSTCVKNPHADDYFVVVDRVGHLYEITGRHGSFDVYGALLDTTHIYSYSGSNAFQGGSGTVLKALHENASPDYRRTPHVDRSWVVTNPYTGRLDVKKAV